MYSQILGVGYCNQNPCSSLIIAASETSASFFVATNFYSTHISEVDAAIEGVTGCACAVDND